MSILLTPLAYLTCIVIAVMGVEIYIAGCSRGNKDGNDRVQRGEEGMGFSRREWRLRARGRPERGRQEHIPVREHEELLR